MMLSDGIVSEYESLRRATAQTFLAKLTNFANKYEAEKKAMKRTKKHGR